MVSIKCKEYLGRAISMVFIKPWVDIAGRMVHTVALLDTPYLRSMGYSQNTIVFALEHS